ncbi:hypothetical protein DFH11DRAFT_1885608 [Phellopilus nigrolimitatus]|nr:hypothetical protein DFH11DRAFT_1885608 [Phellopilus nigrolimitatus]
MSEIVRESTMSSLSSNSPGNGWLDQIPRHVPGYALLIAQQALALAHVPHLYRKVVPKARALLDRQRIDALSESRTFDQAQDIPAGTTNVLAHFASRITSDLVLLPCDFLSPPSLRLETVLNKSKIEAGTDGVLVTALFFENKASENEKGTGAAKEAWPAPSVPMPILYDLASDELELRMSMLWQYPRTKFTTRVVDVLMYVCKHAVLDALQLKKAHLDPNPRRVHPLAVQCSYTTYEAAEIELGLESHHDTPANSLALQHSTSYHPSSHKSKVVVTLADWYAASVNNVHTYLGTEGPPIARARHALVDMKSTVSPDSLVGVSTRVGERSTLSSAWSGDTA